MKTKTPIKPEEVAERILNPESTQEEQLAWWGFAAKNSSLIDAHGSFLFRVAYHPGVQEVMASIPHTESRPGTSFDDKVKMHLDTLQRLYEATL